jgi:hypothetical protein
MNSKFCDTITELWMRFNFILHGAISETLEEEVDSFLTLLDDEPWRDNF